MHGTSLAIDLFDDPRLDVPLVDPKMLYKTCIDRGLPTEHWYGKANSAFIPMHREPTKVNILIKKSNLDAFGTSNTFKVYFNDGANTVAVGKLFLVKATCVLPGSDGDPDAVYMAELTDFRGMPYRRNYVNPIGTAVTSYFNIFSGDPDGSYASETINGASPYTWQELLSAVSTLAGYGTLTLPFTPHGTPGPFDYRGWNPLDALYHLLDRLACGIKVDPTRPVSESGRSVVRLGVADATAAAAMAVMTPTLWDEYAVDSYYQNGGAATVWFRVYPEQPGVASNDNWYADTGESTGGSGQGVHLYDDAVGIKYFSGSTAPENDVTELNPRAEERATDWQRKHDGYDRPLNRVFSGIYPNAVRDVLGSTVGAIAYYDRGDGYKTQVMSRPTTSLEKWRPAGAATRGSTLWVGPNQLLTYRTSGGTSEEESWMYLHGEGMRVAGPFVAEEYGVSDGTGVHTLGIDGSFNTSDISTTVTVRKGLITSIA